MLDLGLDLAFDYLCELAFQVFLQLGHGVLSEPGRLGLGLGIRKLLNDNLGLVVASRKIGEPARSYITLRLRRLGLGGGALLSVVSFSSCELPRLARAVAYKEKAVEAAWGCLLGEVD